MSEEQKKKSRNRGRGRNTPTDEASQGGGNDNRRRRRRRRRSRKGGDSSNSNQNNQSSSSNNKSSGGGSNNQGGGGGRSRNKSSNRGSNRRRSNNNSNNNNSNRRSNKRNAPESKFGGRDPINPDGGADRGETLELNAFELFCTYHLGITEDNGYRKPRAKEVARRFDVSINEMYSAMERLQIDKSAFDKYKFDLSLAQLDIRVAPDGVDRREIAKVHYGELLELNPDMGQELDQESE